MFSLSCKDFPPDAEALRAALGESLRGVLTPATPMVTLEEKSYPQLAAIRISLDGANAGERPPPAPSRGRSARSNRPCRVEHFEISGRPILVQRAKVEL